MRARQLSNVSSSTPAAIRVWLVDFDWFMALDSEAAVPDICGLVAVDSVAAGADIVGLDTAGVDVGPPEDSIVSIFGSLAQPPRMSPKKIIQIVFLCMSHLRQIVLTQSTLMTRQRNKGTEKDTLQPVRVCPYSVTRKIPRRDALAAPSCSCFPPDSRSRVFRLLN